MEEIQVDVQNQVEEILNNIDATVDELQTTVNEATNAASDDVNAVVTNEAVSLATKHAEEATEAIKISVEVGLALPIVAGVVLALHCMKKKRVSDDDYTGVG